MGYSETIANRDIIFITCVSPDDPHPSGRLARRYRDSGVRVETAFTNSRKVGSILHDSLKIWEVTRKTEYKAAIINVNGPLVQLAALAALSLRGIPVSIWIMDSYPGCLKYVTRFWFIFWVPFLILAWIVKHASKASFIIDESFANHVPTSRYYRRRSHHIPLPIPPVELLRRGIVSTEKTIGIIGNIEQEWIDTSFASFIERARSSGFRILVATSRPVKFPEMCNEGVEFIFPWPKEMTEAVFSSCDFVLVPLSSDRMIYSCPSKIVEAYARGIQPIVWVDVGDWRTNRDRLVYQCCVHVDDLFLGCTPHTPTDLIRFAGHWIDGWDDAIDQTLRLAADRTMNRPEIARGPNS